MSKNIEKNESFDSEKDQKDDEISEAELSEIIEEGDDNKTSKMFSRMTARLMQGRFPDPVREKITPEHITKIIDNSDKQDERERKERFNQRIFNILIIVIIIFLIFFLQSRIILFPQIRKH